MIFLKEYSTENGSILAMCDEELIGKVLKSGKLVIDLDKYASFYKGDLISEEDAAKAISSEEIYSANIVGERSISIVIKNGLVDEKDVMLVGKVPFVQIYKII